MRHRLASLLRRLADRLESGNRISMTIQDGSGKVILRDAWYSAQEPIHFKLFEPEGEVSGTISESGEIVYQPDSQNFTP